MSEMDGFGDESDDFLNPWVMPTPCPCGRVVELSEGPTMSDPVDPREIVETARADHDPVRTFLLFSGGTDSLALMESVGDLADEIVHINTGIGIPETNQYVRDVIRGHYGRDLTELHPPIPYDDLVLNQWAGFPGPAAHRFAYILLKERPLRELLRKYRTRNGQRFLLLAGVRTAESTRRMGHAVPVHREGGQVWVNPILTMTNAEKVALLAERNPPRNEVSDHLHMSGECLCGAFAKPGELDEIGFFYPHVAERIRDLEHRARHQGIKACKWGERPPKKDAMPPGPMCAGCVEWAEDEIPNVLFDPSTGGRP